ncbi:aromatic amino acid ammonia-lyase [Arthrobacter sp. 35W]|uniref:aromatic amino acid ammonia-lyase n=1 Tax=Arthrobacter sp. 35W TaxID=1132441 RepID=UPI0018CBECA9|nr:aromatic amino acid ammonia-lyase [Arthrobacter sp. 35W]
MSNTVLKGTGLSAAQLASLAAKPAAVDADPAAREQVRRAWQTAVETAAHRPVYGRTTGVGANRGVAVDGAEAGNAQDLRLLRSHATGSGALLPSTAVRAAMLVRMNQLLKGGSGIHPDIIDALLRCLADGDLPRVHSHGAIGTADLSAFAEIALGLMGEVPLASGALRSYWTPAIGDALPFISTNALTAASTALALAEAELWLEHYLHASACSLMAVNGSLEPFADEVHLARPLPGQAWAAAQIRHLLTGYAQHQWRVQDSFGFRTLAQVAGALRSSLDALTQVLEIELNASTENPLVSPAARDVFHNGNFHLVELALALDHTKLAIYSTAQLSGARLNNLSDPGMTGQAPFLAVGEPGSSGIMLLEYNCAAALARLRNAAAPATLGAAVISRGFEDHSSFASQAAEQLHSCLEAAATALGCELYAAVRALSITGAEPPSGTELGRYLAKARGLFDASLADRPLGGDLAAAVGFLQQPIES